MTANPPAHIAPVVFTNGDGDVQYRAILGLFARSTLAPVQLLQFASVREQPRRAPRPNGNWRGCVGLPVRPAVAVATATPSAPGPPWADGSGLVPGGRGPYNLCEDQLVPFRLRAGHQKASRDSFLLACDWPAPNQFGRLTRHRFPHLVLRWRGDHGPHEIAFPTSAK
jgi:hypothetical protein